MEGTRQSDTSINIEDDMVISEEHEPIDQKPNSSTPNSKG